MASVFFLPELVVSTKSASFHFMQYSFREPRLLSLLVHRETRPSSSGVWKELTWATPLPVWSVIAELAGAVLAGAGAVLAGAGAVLIICVILNVGAVLAGAGAGLVIGVPVLDGAEVVFSGAKVRDADFSGAADVACPGAVDIGSVRIFGTSGLFPLSMPTLLLLTPAFSAVLVPLASAPVSGTSC
jgi:hypothetical protein